VSHTRFAALLASVFLASCGGGGGGGSNPPPPAPPPPAATYQLSGQIRTADNTLVDSDVNDRLAPYASNDSFAAAQALPNPGTLGGYVNVAGSGSTGRSMAIGDRADYFRIDANAGQAISLVVADPSAGDLDLYLYNEAQTLVASSTGTGKLEYVPINASGRYYARVYAYSGHGTYVMTVGKSSAAAAAAAADSGALLSAAEFVPGEVVVRWRAASHALAANSKNSQSSIMAAHALTKLAGAAESDWLLKLDNPATHLLQASDKPVALGRGVRAFSAVELKSATLSAIKQLRANPNVEYAEPNYIVRAHAVPNDTHYPLQWHYPLINLPAAWDVTTGSSSVIVGVIDTGVLLNHPDLQGRLVAGYDFITDPASAGDGDGPDNDPNDVGDADTPGGGSSFHGTHVAGTIAASSNNGLGVAGVAWGARVMPLRVLGLGGTGSSFDIMQAVLYAARLPNSSGTLPAQRADIINLSLGGSSPSQAAQNAINQARAQGVIIVASAGNEGNSVPMYPASYDGVVSVSAVNINQALSNYSSYGSTVDIAAPGGEESDVNGDGYVDQVLSTWADDSAGNPAYGYRFYQGTSMAAPHVAGVFALMKSVSPTLTPDNIDALLAAGRLTVDLGTPGRDNSFGHGLIDALKAVQAAQSGGTTPAPAALVATPSVLNFSPDTNTQTFTASNGGGGTLSVTSVQVTPPAAWLSVVAPTAASGLGTYTVIVNRGTLAPGAYAGNVRLVSAANSVDIPVVMQVSESGVSVSSNLGEHYVLLLDPDTLDTVGQVRAQAVGGVYSFRFSDVPAGNYVLFAGSDPNNDDSLCDVGEACGAYVSLDSPAVVTVNGNRSGLDFFSGYVTAIGANAQGIGRPPIKPSRIIKRLK
jgi:serine protease